MTGAEGRQVFETMRPQDAIDRLCLPCGVLARQRQLDLGRRVRAMVISAGTPGGASQADVWRAYLAWEGPRVARAACSRWVDEPLDRFMEALAARALAYARAPPVDRSGPLGGVTDGSMGDSPTVKVRAAWMEDVPGTGASAAIKVHHVLAGGGGAPGPSHVSPARAPARRPLAGHASWRGDGLLADRASARLARRRAGEAPAGPCVIRRTDHGQPTVASSARGPVTQECWPGTALEARRAAETRRLEGRVMDAEGPVGRGTPALPRRLVGGQPPKGSGGFLTHLPPRLGPRPVADLDRGRWAGARRLQRDTSGPRLAAIDAERPCALKALRQAARLAAILAARLAQTPHLHTRPQPIGAPRPEAPLPPRRLALPLAVSCQSRAQASDLQGDEATRRWDKIAAWLTHAGSDPHGRRRPSG